MTAQSVTCPSESMLTDFSLGKLDAAQAEAISRHLETCADCRRRVAGVSGDSFVGRLRQADAKPAPRRDRTYVPGESLANAANSTDGIREDGLPRPSSKETDHQKRDGLGSPSSHSAPPELANHPDYELIKELGQGGMGTVYLAKNRMMDRMEVLKVISKSLLDRPGALERFQQEIRSAAKLLHPNIVAAHSVLRPGDLLVFAMEYVKGQDLSQVVKARGYLPVANAAFYIHQVALGLQHAHEKGMVHRDIKPNNLMLAIEGKKHTVKILDFGLAKATSEKGGETGLTKSGQMLGTPDFIAPEQTLDAHKADIRADIYSLGCTLYFLLSGGPPFEESSLYALLDAHHKRDAKPLNLVRPEVPVELATVVATMMAKDPSKRYPTPIEVAKALVPFFKSGQSVATPAPREAAALQPVTETEQGLGAATPLSPIAPPLFPVPVMPVVATPMPIVATDPANLLSVSIDTGRPAAKRRIGWWRSLPPWQRWTALGGGALAFLLGVLLLVSTPHGTVKIALSDPKAKVDLTVDGDRIGIAGLDEPLSLVVGDHGLKVTGEGYETITEQFKVTRGKNAPLTIQLVRLEPAPEPAKQPAPPPGGPPALTPDGFIPLFNGKDLTGWKPHPSRQGLWRVDAEKGVLIGSGPATSYLFSERGNFTNFHLRAEVRINDGGNGGVFARSTFSAEPWIDGYEAQINSTAPDKNKTGSLYKSGKAIVSVADSIVRPGEWFTLEVIATDYAVTTKVNGKTTVDKHFDSACSFRTGHIALQQHAPQTVVEFRKIEIKELPLGALARPVAVPTDAEVFGGHWYKFYPEQLNWKAARDRCQSNGGHLVIFDSLAENDFVAKLVEKAGWHAAWIGITDEAQEGTWRTVDGEAIQFQNWFKMLGERRINQPNNENNVEHYALICDERVGRSPPIWRWWDEPNEPVHFHPGFVCEWESAPTFPSPPPGAALPQPPPSTAGDENRVDLPPSAPPGTPIVPDTLEAAATTSSPTPKSDPTKATPPTASAQNQPQASSAAASRRAENGLPSEAKEAAKAFEKAREQARAKLLTEFDTALDRLARTKGSTEQRLKLIEAVKEEKNRFESRGLIPWSEPMRTFLAKYFISNSAAEDKLLRVYASLIDAQRRAKNESMVAGLKTDLENLIGVRLLAKWRVIRDGRQPGWIASLYSNGTVNNVGKWSFSNGVLVFRWTDSKAPGGAWLDNSNVSADGTAYVGTNNAPPGKKAKFTGMYLKDD